MPNVRYFGVFAKIRALLQLQLQQGLSVRAAAQAVALAVTIGVFPIMGCSTLMNTTAALRLRLNQPIVQSFNWLCAPLKLLLIFPFLRLGEYLFQAPPFVMSLQELSRRFFEDRWGTLQEFAWTFGHAIAGWLLCAPLLYLLLFAVTLPILKGLVSRSR